VDVRLHSAATSENHIQALGYDARIAQ